MLYWSEKLQRAESRQTDLVFKITGAKASTELQAMPVLKAYDAIASQAVIDAHLGTTNEFLLAAFDATSMGTDAFAGILNMGGQAKEVKSFKVELFDSADAQAVCKAKAVSTALTASTLATEVACGASGNIAFKAVLTGLDALTSGLIKVSIIWKSK